MALERLKLTGTTAKEIQAAGKKNKINPRKFEDANLYNLPKKGTFTGWDIHKNTINGTVNHYYVMHAEDAKGDKYEYSVSAIQKMLNRDIEKASEGVLSKIGGESKWSEFFKLEGAKPINPKFMGSQPKMIEKFLDKDFTVKEISGYTAKFTDKEDEKEVQLKSGVLLTLVD